jgi:hypothetical protein
MSNFAKNQNMSADEKTAAGETAAPKTDTKPQTKDPAGDTATSPTAAPKSDSKH